MTTELTKAAQRLIEASEAAAKHFGYLRLGGCTLEDANVRVELRNAADELRALTQRPAAQTEREAPRWTVSVEPVAVSGETDAHCLRASIGNQSFHIGPDYMDTKQEAEFFAEMFLHAIEVGHRASLPAPQQATPVQDVGASADYWGDLAQQKADADARRGVSMPVSYYTSSIVGALLAAQQATPEPVGEAALLVAEIMSLADEYAEAEAKAGGLTGCGGDIGQQHELDEDAAYIKGRLNDAVNKLSALTTRPAPVETEPVGEPNEMESAWCWWVGDGERFHIVDTESEAHGEAQCHIDDDCDPGQTHEYSVARVQHPLDALGMDWLALHVAESIAENVCCWCDDNTGAEEPSIMLSPDDSKALGVMVATFLRQRVGVEWWTADQKTVTVHTYVSGSNDNPALAAAQAKGGEHARS